MKKIRALVLLLASIGLCHGQTATSRKISFRCVSLGMSGQIAEAVIVAGPKDPLVKVPMAITDLSPAMEGTFAGSEAVLSIETKGPDGKPAYQPVARAPLAKSNHQLFLLIPNAPAPGKLPYSLLIYDDDTTAVPMGCVRMINISPYQVRLDMGGVKQQPVAPLKAGVFPCTVKVDDYNMYQGKIEFLMPSKQWEIFHASSLKSSKAKRDLYICMIDPTLRLPSVRAFNDIPPWVNAQ
jgi:hypothetical protein